MGQRPIMMDLLQNALMRHFQIVELEGVACLPDLMLWDFFLCGYLKDIVYEEPSVIIMERQEKIEEVWGQVTDDTSAFRSTTEYKNIWVDSFISVKNKSFSLC